MHIAQDWLKGQPRRVRLAAPYGVAVISSLAALGVGFLLSSPSTPVARLLFLAAVATTAWYGGFRPALLATALGFLALDYFFEVPPYSFEISDVRTLLDSAAYVFVALLVGSLNAQLRAARARADSARLEAEAAVRARDEALAAVSHDMRTPITSIQASIAALQESDAGLPEEVRQRLMANIAADSERLRRFISDALALNRIESGVPPNPTMNAAGEIVSAILDRYMLQLAGRRIEFDIPDTLPLLWFDTGLMEQAIGNLLDNVAVHTPAGTDLGVIGRIDTSGHFRLEIADAGPGIPDEARERVFARFERLGVRGPSAGLGLTLARAAIEAQGGRVWVEPSRLGGACFVLELPCTSLARALRDRGRDRDGDPGRDA
jgi:K+-sensing histidine kinase KdpD